MKEKRVHQNGRKSFGAVRNMTIVILFILLLLFTFNLNTVYASPKMSVYYASVKCVMYACPNTKSKKVATIKRGTKLEMRDKHSGWCVCEDKKGNYGYIKLSKLSRKK